ncbi:lipase family protein [Corynebacterium sp. ES2794-CONJ1]|uniref:lipase family protein n=1 Tax=unclassified Corynebacterium TaxID=2624378 RepID=UPI002168119B|nr:MULTISPECIES: lipase family protein [unclassified Corynebacterium]MCS4491927.1 lipase family protein [Corynebacterium sp. ES2715-CONJ3]MCS4532032.1 lipase family protein [Corynebacterium sp. ES2730-CONJ]MCU9519433.1 lipase family protein [Corynebacterium sp. ES2794-CONJ1]
MKSRQRLIGAISAIALSVGSCVLAVPAVAQSSVNDVIAGVDWAGTHRTDAWVESPIDDAFYATPEVMDPRPGAVLRTQPAPHLLNTFGPRFPAYAQKILYTSTTQDGRPVPVSGYIMEPRNPWRGPGPVPTVIFAPGTRGQADICAPSRGAYLLGSYSRPDKALGINYEIIVQYHLLELGMRVVNTDYIGLGTEGVHTYVNNIEEAHAVLDAARAALSVANVDPRSPIAFYGYSQGGGAAAAAAEFASSYAPELNVKGTYAGAVPADLPQVIKAIDGSSISGVLGMSINSYAARDPEFRSIVKEYLNEAGEEFLRRSARSCLADAAVDDGLKTTRFFTKDGRTLSESLGSDPRIIKILDRQKLGRKKPSAPIMVGSAIHDDLVPNAQVRQLSRDYCQLGAEVYYFESSLPVITPSIPSGLNHAAQAFGDLPEAARYLYDRFLDRPALNNCPAT